MTARDRRCVGVSTVCVLTVLLAAACGSSSSSGSDHAGSAARPTKSTYRMGVMADLTGPAAVLGVPQLAGADFWASQTNASGGIDGHPVSLVSCDSQGSAQGGVTCASKLSGLPIVIATSLIGPDEAALPSFSNSLVLATTPLLLPTKAANPNVFQTEPTIGQSDGLALAAAQKSGIHTVGVIATDDATGTGAVKAMQAEASTYGVTLSVQYVTEAVASATVQVSQLESAHAGMIFVAAPGGPAAVVAGAYKSLGLSIPLVLTSADATNDFLQSIKSLDLSTLYAAPAAAVVPGALEQPYQSKLEALFANYQRKTGKTMDYATLLGYYSVQLGGDVLAAVGYGAGLPAFETYVDTHALTTDLGPLEFKNPTSNIETGISPVMVQMAPDKTSFQPCRSTAGFTC